jgi:hypothetical protein
MSADPSFLKKIIQLFKTSKRSPPPTLGDGKYDSEMSPDELKQSIIKDLTAQKRGLPEDFDIVMEFINLAKAGGYGKLDPKQLPAMVFPNSNSADLGMGIAQVTCVASSWGNYTVSAYCSFGETWMGFPWSSSYFLSWR